MIFVAEAYEGQLRRLKSMFNEVKSLKFPIGTRRTNVSKGRQSLKPLYVCAVASCKDSDHDDNISNNNINILMLVVVVVVVPIHKLCSYTSSRQLKIYESRRKSRGKYITGHMVIKLRVVHYKGHTIGEKVNSFE
jgi:hypothetical protein